jgi:hypothetical protein
LWNLEKRGLNPEPDMDGSFQSFYTGLHLKMWNFWAFRQLLGKPLEAVLCWVRQNCVGYRLRLISKIHFAEQLNHPFSVP